MSRLILRPFLLAILAPVFGAHAQLTTLDEGFDDFAAATSTGGWLVLNNSTPPNPFPVAEDTWAQGSTGRFAAFAGDSADSFAGVSYTSGDPEGAAVSNWLITPVLSLANGAQISFYTTQQIDDTFANRLELRLSRDSGAVPDAGESATSLGTFTTLLLDINPTLDPAGYPQTWTRYSVTLSGLSAPTMGRLAFRYVLPDSALDGSYVGLDSVSYNVATVPEPASTSLLFTMLVAGGALAARCRRLRQTSATRR